MPTVTESKPNTQVPLYLNEPNRSYDDLLEAIGDAQVVLIGDGTHGTHEFYAERAHITRRLVEEKGFRVVAVEADWPDAYRVNRYVKGTGPDRCVASALSDFVRFPQWMWRNDVMVHCVEWMRSHNDKIMERGGDPREKVTFHGLDMYSLHKSAAEVIKYFEKYDSKAAVLARKRYSCFDKFGSDIQNYALFTGCGMAESCEKEVIKVLTDLLSNDAKMISDSVRDEHDGKTEEKWVAKMNALLVKDAEQYYRHMMTEDVKTWNLRDNHMYRVLEEVIQHQVGPDGKPAKAVVWAHNSHLGDARATEMGIRNGELNVGQLCRQKMGIEKVYSIGFLTSEGTVTAAHDWDGLPHKMPIVPALSNSVERMLGNMTPDGHNNFTVLMHRRVGKGDKIRAEAIDKSLNDQLNKPLLQRFIGVLYKPKTERWSHYSTSKLADQFDAACYIHKTRALRPIDRPHHFHDDEGDVPETFPFGL